MNGYNTYLEGAGVTELPPEYATLALEVPPNFPPKPFTVNDIVANAVLIQSALGGGGGGEATNVELLQKLDPSIGPNTKSLPKGTYAMWPEFRLSHIATSPHPPGQPSPDPDHRRAGNGGPEQV